MKEKDSLTQGLVDEILFKQLMNLNIHKYLGWQPHEIKLGSRITYYLHTISYFVVYWFVAMVILIGLGTGWIDPDPDPRLLTPSAILTIPLTPKPNPDSEKYPDPEPYSKGRLDPLQ